MRFSRPQTENVSESVSTRWPKIELRSVFSVNKVSYKIVKIAQNSRCRESGFLLENVTPQFNYGNLNFEIESES